MTKNCFRSLLLGVSCLALAHHVRAEWQYGFDESAKYGYIEDAATGCKLWVRSNTSTKLPVYSTVGGVEGYQVYRSDSASAVASLPSGGVVDLSDVATGPAGKPVVSAGWSSFLNSEIVSLRAPDLREVGRDAFNGCGLLEGVEFSSEISVLLGSNSFKGCTNLVTISPTYCPNVTSFGGNFQGLKKLTGDWDFPNVTSGSALFRSCSSITSIRAAKMTSVGDYFAQNCTSLTNVCLPKLETLSIQCFFGCTSLKSVTLNPEMTSLGSSCFSGCTALEDIRPRVFPNVTVLGQQAFINCSSLRGTLEFTKLGALPSNPSAFAAFQASGLDAVELPALTNISATGTFQKMPNLARVTLSGAGASTVLITSALFSVSFCTWTVETFPVGSSPSTYVCQAGSVPPSTGS